MNYFMIAAGITISLIVIAFIRVILGPRVLDRVVGLETMNVLSVSTLLLIGTALNEVVFIDVAVLYALLNFVGTLFISNYIEEAES